MTKKNGLTQKVLSAFMAGVLAMVALPAMATMPSSGASHPKRVPKASVEGILPMNQVGWKVAFICASASATLVVDEDGNAPTRGVLHKVYTSSGAATSELFTVYDSSAADTVSNRDLVQINRSTTQTVFSEELDSQFNRGLVMKNSVASGCGYVLWSPDGKRD